MDDFMSNSDSLKQTKLIRYYKLGFSGEYSIWMVRDDGLERCIFNTDGDPQYYARDWHNPEKMGDTSIPDCIKRTPKMIKEITEQEAFLEML